MKPDTNICPNRDLIKYTLITTKEYFYKMMTKKAEENMLIWPNASQTQIS